MKMYSREERVDVGQMGQRPAMRPRRRTIPSSSQRMRYTHAQHTTTCRENESTARKGQLTVDV
jgi:hypothetical protein